MVLKGKQVLAYAAGIVDGEGSIIISKSKHKRYAAGYRYELYGVVGNTNEWLCRWLKMQFGGLVTYQRLRTLSKRDFWTWSLRAKSAGSFLEVILPYLQLKRPQAEIAVNFQKGKYRGRPHNDKEKELAVEEVKRLLIKAAKGR